MIKNIIIQAGGKGSRLEHLTFNKPKCIVPVNNLPIIFYAFKKFPDASFKIIADYKIDVLEKYLEVFATEYDYEIIAAQGEGTCAGIKDAIGSIKENTPFLLMWSDLILSDHFNIPEEIGSYIGISRDFECRWSYMDNQLKKISSKENGVAGLFVFNDKSLLADIPSVGEFVAYISNLDIAFKPLYLYGTKEIGTMVAYENNSDNTPKCRPFNKMEFYDDIVIKTPITDQGVKIARDEIAWYKKIKEIDYKNIPNIYNFEPLTMDKIEGKNIFEYNNLSRRQKKRGCKIKCVNMK